MMDKISILFGIFLFALMSLAATAEEGWRQTKGNNPDGPIIVLHSYGIWRFQGTIEPPLLASGRNVELKYAWLNYKTPGPPPEWMSTHFDDRLWDRGPVTLACKSAMLARVCLRGKFTVTNPSAVGRLGLTVGYRGGLIVYVNGQEVHREHLTKGGTVAEGPAGAERLLTDFAIQPGLLRKGVNVLGLEVIRAPYPEQTQENVFEENSCQVLSAKLTSDSPVGLVPKAVRPLHFQVWNADPLAVDLDVDFGDEAEPLRPVLIVGARNGSFTGKISAGSSKPIGNLRVIPTDLQGPRGTIPAANVRIRYGVPWGEYRQVNAGNRRFSTPYPRFAQRLGALAEKPLAEFPVLASAHDNYYPALRPDVSEIKPVNGAVVPISITITIPKDIPAGPYSGSVTVKAQGEEAVQVPLEVRVADWSLPDTRDFRTWVDMIQCPDTLALEYKVPLWSDRHWELIAQSFRLIGETGSRTLYVPLIAHTNLGNEQSMVRWVKKGDRYDYDFSILERYLDLAEKNMGRPKLIVLVVWDVYMIPAADAADEAKEEFAAKATRRACFEDVGYAGTRTNGHGVGSRVGEDGVGDAAAAPRPGGQPTAVAAVV